MASQQGGEGDRESQGALSVRVQSEEKLRVLCVYQIDQRRRKKQRGKWDWEGKAGRGVGFQGSE